MLDKGVQLKLPQPRNPEDLGMAEDPRDSVYHRAWGHPSKSCWSLNATLRAFVDAGALRLKALHNRAPANMACCMQFSQTPPGATAGFLVPAVEVRVTGS